MTRREVDAILRGKTPRRRFQALRHRNHPPDEHVATQVVSRAGRSHAWIRTPSAITTTIVS
jgi:hypothetical protein